MEIVGCYLGPTHVKASAALCWGDKAKGEGRGGRAGVGGFARVDEGDWGLGFDAIKTPDTPHHTCFLALLLLLLSSRNPCVSPSMR